MHNSSLLRLENNSNGERNYCWHFHRNLSVLYNDVESDMLTKPSQNMFVPLPETKDVYLKIIVGMAAPDG